MTASRLFSPITLRGLTLDNRIVLSPMCQYASQDGNPSAWHTVHLGTYALANLGLAITEATAVLSRRVGFPRCASDSYWTRTRKRSLASFASIANSAPRNSASSSRTPAARLPFCRRS